MYVLCLLLLLTQIPTILNAEKLSRIEILKQYAPLIYLHSQEKYFPCSVEWFASQSSLWKITSSTKEAIQKRSPKKKIFDAGDLKAQDISKLKNYTDAQYFLKPKSKKMLTGEPLADNKCQAPCYAHMLNKADGGFLIQYLFFYAYNGPTLTIGPVSFGTHEGDWEHIDVHVGADYSITDIFLAAHGANRFGVYANLKKLGWYENTHPIIYSSLYGHSSYPEIMTIPNKALDRTNKGATWDTQHAIIDIDAPGQEWIQFRGFWGSSQPKSFEREVGSPETPFYTWLRKKSTEPQEKIFAGAGFSVEVYAKPLKKNKIKLFTSTISSLGNLIKQTKKNHHSKLFDIDGRIPTRCKQFRISMQQNPQNESDQKTAIKSFSLYQERLARSDKLIYKNIPATTQGTILTRPQFDESREKNNISLTSLYVTDIEVDKDRKAENSFQIKIHPLEH